MLGIIKRMEDIAAINGIVDGAQLIHSANTLKSLVMIREGKIDEALELVESSYLKMVDKFRG